MPGVKPASASPRRKRAAAKLFGPTTKAVAIERIPHEIMMRAIQMRAPTFCMMRLLGISNKKYPMKNMPAPNPNCSAVKPRSLFMVSAANPTFVLSR